MNKLRFQTTIDANQLINQEFLVLNIIHIMEWECLFKYNRCVVVVESEFGISVKPLSPLFIGIKKFY